MSSRGLRRGTVRRLLLALVAAALTAARPSAQFQTPATASPADRFPNFDIRRVTSAPKLAGHATQAAYLRAVAPPPAAEALASGRDARAALGATLPGIHVEADGLGGAAVVSAMPGTPWLSAGGDDRVATLRRFLAAHGAAYGLTGGQVDALTVVADELNPAGNMAWVELEQRVNGLAVFQGHLRGAFTAKGDLARTNGLLATGVGATPPASPALSATEAVAIAAANVALPAAPLRERAREGDVVVFERGGMAAEPRAWLVYFPLAHGVVRLAWAVEVYGDPLAFLTVLDADTGTVVFRKHLTEFQTQAATYHVYTSDSPAPASPSPALPGAGYIAPLVARQAVTLIGNEPPNDFNALGWIADGGNTTDGNNVEAGLDRDSVNGVDAPVAGTGRVFDFAYNPGPGSPPPGDQPLTPAHQHGEVTNMFYWVNRHHDETYRLGFTEAFRNFQHDNFGRGGSGLDRISAETQDAAAINSASFTTPSDGGRGRMQMHVWNGPTPQRGGGLDADLMLHELTHGLSNRLHANASGLVTNMSRGLGEGWSDFYARALLSEASEPVDGLYTVGGWATAELATGVENYYYGLRRFPYAVRTTAGANGRPHNPLTFADIDARQADLTRGAHPPGPHGSTSRDQVHEMGQVWAAMLFEVRARFITRLGFADGNRRVLQLVTDGMKGDPVGPTFLQARDAILAAAHASGGTAADIADIWSGFAARGLGVTAAILDAGTGVDDTRVIESHLRPGDPAPTFSIDDVAVREGDGGPTPFTFTVSLANPSGGTATVAYETAPGTADSAAGSPVGTSAGPIAIPGGAPVSTSGPAGPYPATIDVSGLPGTVTSLAVRLNGLTHRFPDDLDILLVGPGGQAAMVMSDAGGSGDISGLTLTFRDGAPAPSTTQLTTGTYAPTDITPGDVMAAPAPAGPYPSSLSVFNGTDPNGTWRLYVVDDMGGGSGSLGSVTLLVATTGRSPDFAPASGTLTFPPGTTSLPVHVTVLGDSVVEFPETFFVYLSNPVNALLGRAQGVGTILNDDGTPPTAVPDAFSTPFATPAVVAAPGVLGNDATNGGGALTATLLTAPRHGTLDFPATGAFTYIPAPGFAGTDGFTYRVESAIGLTSNAGAVTLTVDQPTTAQPPTDVYVSSVVGHRVTVRWTPPTAGPAPTGFLLEGGVSAGQVLAQLPLGPVPIVTLDAPAGVFRVRLRTVSAAGVSAASNDVPLHVNVASPPSAPAALLGVVDGTTFGLAWRNTFGGGAPTATLLEVTGAAQVTLPLGAVESMTRSGVPPGTYTFRVRGTNRGGPGPASNPVTLTFPGPCSGAPEPPTRFLAYRLDRLLRVVWEPPAGGFAPTGYVLQASGAVSAELPLAATSMAVAVPAGTYYLRVRAVNACGASAFTDRQSLTFP